LVFAAPAGCKDHGDNEFKGEHMLTKELKQSIMEQYARTEGDTGSPEVQVAVLTKEIEVLNDHLTTHKHDFHSRRGLLKKIGRRRNLLRYLQGQDINRYRDLIKSLGLRR